MKKILAFCNVWSGKGDLEHLIDMGLYLGKTAIDKVQPPSIFYLIHFPAGDEEASKTHERSREAIQALKEEGIIKPNENRTAFSQNRKGYQFTLYEQCLIISGTRSYEYGQVKSLLGGISWLKTFQNLDLILNASTPLSRYPDDEILEVINECNPKKVPILGIREHGRPLCSLGNFSTHSFPEYELGFRKEELGIILKGSRPERLAQALETYSPKEALLKDLEKAIQAVPQTKIFNASFYTKGSVLAFIEMIGTSLIYQNQPLVFFINGVSLEKRDLMGFQDLDFIPAQDRSFAPKNEPKLDFKKRITLINGYFFDNLAYEWLSKQSEIFGCFGDKTLERAIFYKKLPFAEVQPHKRETYRSLIELIKAYDADFNELSMYFKRLKKFSLTIYPCFGIRETKQHPKEFGKELAQALTPSLFQQWEKFSTYLHEHYNFFDKLPGVLAKEFGQEEKPKGALSSLGFYGDKKGKPSSPNPEEENFVREEGIFKMEL